MLDGFHPPPGCELQFIHELELSLNETHFFCSPFRTFFVVIRNKIKNKICRKTVVIMQIKEIRFLPLGFQIHFLAD